MGRIRIERGLIAQFISVIICFICAAVIFLDNNAPVYYNWLPILPLLNGILNSFSYRLFDRIPNNISLTILLALIFFRLSIAPLFLTLGGYTSTIIYNVSENTLKAILLMAYEAIFIYAALHLFINMNGRKRREKHINQMMISKIKFSYKLAVLALLVLLIITFIIVPEQRILYRTIFGVKDIHFTSIEASYIVSRYGTTVYKKGAIVLGQYLANILKIVIPAIVIYELHTHIQNRKISLALSALVALTQFLMVDGAIGKSVYYCLMLFLFIIYLYKLNLTKVITLSLVLGMVAVVLYFYMRYLTNKDKYTNIFEYLSRISSAYFSGVNIVSGSFNLPKDLGTKIHYFFYDYLKSIPFSNTLFRLQNTDIQMFFNEMNYSSGQIPPTIGVCYYYFGFLLSPLYSVILAVYSYKVGDIAFKEQNIIKNFNYIFLSVMLPLGIIMYNHFIILTKVFTIFIPMLLLQILFNKDNIKGV